MAKNEENPSCSMFRMQSSQILQKKIKWANGSFFCVQVLAIKNEKILPDRTIFEGRWFTHSRLKYPQIFFQKEQVFLYKNVNVYDLSISMGNLPEISNRSATNTYRTTIRDLLARITAHSHHSFQRDTPKNILGKKMNYYRLLLLLE